MKTTFYIMGLACLLGLSQAIAADAPAGERVELKHGAHRQGKRTDADMQRWRDHGLGQFIHWGVYSMLGGKYEGKQFGGASEWIRVWKELPHSVYDNLYKQFNPTDFNAGQWAGMAKDMGARYVIFTTKHHDGFCMWPSKYTDYTIAQTPYQKDIVGEIVEAYDKAGIDVHLYFSIIDWNHKGYRSSPPTTPEEKAAYEEFKTFTRNQLFELLERYPQVKGLWFDGSWDEAWKKEYAWVDQLGKDLRKFRPGLIIGSRFRADENGKRHYDTNGDLIDDYDQRWERDLPESFEEVGDVDWDSSMTVAENGWGYQEDWTTYVKSPYDIIRMIMQANSMNGNFVLNFGPDGKGNIKPEEAELARQIGQWMNKNGEAVRGVSHAGLKPQGWGYYTQKDGKTYMSVFNVPIDKRLTVVYPGHHKGPAKASFLTDGKELNISSGGRNKLNERIFYIHLPKDFSATEPFVIVLEGERSGKKQDDYQKAIT